MKKLLFIYNAHSGKAQIKIHLSDIIDLFIKAGYEVDIHPTQKPLDAKEQILKKAESYDMIVCSGGDGTLNETVSGVMELEEKPVIGYIPAGSTNDFASSIKLPKRMIDAAEVIVSGNPISVDIGSFNSKNFVYVAGFGAFTEVSYMTSQNLKNVLGHQAYIVEAVKSITKLKSYNMRIEHDGEVIEDKFLYGMVSNSKSVGGFKGIAGKGVKMDDGVFEVTLITPPKNPIELQMIVTTLLGVTKGRCNNIYSFTSADIKFISEINVPWVLDGEYGGSPKIVNITDNHKAISVMSGTKKKMKSNNNK